MIRKKLHKTLLTLLLVFTPPYFLMFTDEGIRITDNAVLWLFGGETFKFNLKEAGSDFDRTAVMQVYSDLQWQCHDEQSPFGDTLCAAAIASFNDFPARYVSAFFMQDRLNAFKIVYREQYHAQILGHLIKLLGQPRNVQEAISQFPDAAPVLEWDTGKGLVVLKKELQKNDEAALLWLAVRS